MSMNSELMILGFSAASLGVLHTLLGPDHYLPFAVMAQAKKWAPFKTYFITFLCGLGHVASSALLGLLGIFLGIAVKHIKIFESWRGDMATWMLIAFGLIYFIWGLRIAVRNKPHTHSHPHLGEIKHNHHHIHDHGHIHLHGEEAPVNLTPWILFIIFVFGPCEPLIPLLMYPAAKLSLLGVFGVVTVFSFFTIGTMMIMVSILYYGLAIIFFKPLEKYTHALAGAIICLSGLGIKFLGL